MGPYNSQIYLDAGLAISQPPAPNDAPSSLLTNFPELQQQSKALHDHALFLPGALHSGQRWIHPAQFPTVLCPHLQQLIHAPAQPPPPRPIHAGQFWHLSPALPSHPQRTIYEILPTQTPNSPPCARVWLPTNPHSHVSPMPGDQYQWTPTSPHLSNPATPAIQFANVPLGTTWNKILCQTPITTDPTGRICRRILSITAVDPPTPTTPTQPSPAHGPPLASDQQPLQLARPLPTSYTIYVDGGWDSTDTDFYSAFQEQRDPTNRRGSAGIAIVPTGTD